MSNVWDAVQALDYGPKYLDCVRTMRMSATAEALNLCYTYLTSLHALRNNALSMALDLLILIGCDLDHALPGDAVC